MDEQPADLKNLPPEHNTTNSVSEADSNFRRLKPPALDALLDNLLDRVNDHGVAIAHDAAVPDPD